MKKRCLIFSIVILLVFLFVSCLFLINNNFNEADNVIVEINNSENLKLTKRFVQPQNEDFLQEVTVTASIEPNIAVDRRVKWSISWIESNYDESISDYVIGDFNTESLEITLKFKKSFPKKIVLKCTSVVNSSAFATCTFDCYERVRNITLNSFYTRFDNGNEESPFVIDNENRIIDVEEKNHRYLDEYYISLLDGIIEEKVGTVRVEYNCYMKINISNTLKELLETKFAIVNKDYKFEDGDFINLESLFCLIIDDFSNIMENNLDDLINILNQTDHWFDVKIEYRGFNNWENLILVDSYDVVYQMKGFIVDYYYVVSGISLNQTNMII